MEQAVDDWSDEAVYLIKRSLRSVAMGAIAALLSFTQTHSDYSEAVIFITGVFLATTHRTFPLAIGLIAFLLALVLITPEMATSLGNRMATVR